VLDPDGANTQHYSCVRVGLAGSRRRVTYGVPVELIEDGCSVAANHAEAMTRGLASMHAEDVQVIATNNFVQTVARMIEKPSYTAERGSGVVAARTVTGFDGSVVVLNYPELSSLPPGGIERALAHEGGHVLINARGTEETSGNRDRTESDWQWLLKCLGALAIVELRIERSLAELGYEPSGAAASDVEQSLLVTNIGVVSAVTSPASADPKHLHDTAITTLDHATKKLAYVAAPLIAGRSTFLPSELSAEGQANWADYVAPTWERRMTLWRSIPSVIEPIPVEKWRTIMREAAELEQAFLRSFGFAFRLFPNGDVGFYRTSGDDVFTRRLDRARTQSDASSA
jgi:hypothetical protein